MIISAEKMHCKKSFILQRMIAVWMIGEQNVAKVLACRASGRQRAALMLHLSVLPVCAWSASCDFNKRIPALKMCRDSF